MASGPARDLWIEICQTMLFPRGAGWSGPARDLWIEICLSPRRSTRHRSGPARDLWIEIYLLPRRSRRHRRRVPQGTCGLKLSRWLGGRARLRVGSRKGPVD